MFFTPKLWVYVSRVLLESIPDFVPWTTATGWQVMRIDWSAPSDVVKSSPGETSESSDYWRERGEGRRGEGGEVGRKEREGRTGIKNWKRVWKRESEVRGEEGRKDHFVHRAVFFFCSFFFCKFLLLE